MINNLLKVIGLIFSAVGAGFLIGKNNEKNKTTKTVLKKVKATQKRRAKRSSDTADSDLKWMLEHKDD